MCNAKYFLFVIFLAGLFILPACKKNNSPVSYNPDVSELNTLVDSISQVYDNAVEGTKPGNYAAGAKTDLKSAIDLATQVVGNKTSYSQQQVDNAVSNMYKAIDLFNSRLIQEVSVANLVAQWKFDGDVTDASGHQHDGELKTGWIGSSVATIADGGTLPQPVPDRFGRAGMAYDFDNAAYVEVPYDAALNPQSFTISLWIKRHTTNSNNYMLSLNRWNGYKLQLQSNNFLFLTIHADNGYHDVDDNPGVIPQDEWTYAAVSYTDGAMKFYINGELKKAVSVTGAPLTLSSPVNLAIGNELPKGAYNLTDSSDPNYFYGASYFIGSLDDIRFYNTALTDAEVLSIYTNEKSL